MEPTKEFNLTATNNAATNSVSTIIEDERFVAENKREKITPGTILKYCAQIALVCTFLLHLGASVDSNVDNPYLSTVNIENSGAKHAQLKREITALENEKNKTSRAVKKIQGKIKTETYTNFSETIAEVKSRHINWFDKIENGRIKEIGVFDAAVKVQKYFDSSAYKDDENILKQGNKIKIISQSITRDSASISLSISQEYKRLFYLVNEFIKQMNSYPFFMGGELNKNFSREKDENGDDSMQVTISMQRQTAEDIDPFDHLYPPFEEWVKSF